MGTQDARGREALERLEARSLLAGSPLPVITDLESPTNTVVRFETNVGDIDIELFNTDAPVSVANFLNYVTTGRYEDTFFHRIEDQTSAGIDVLQGGGFRYRDDLGAARLISTDAPIVRENTGRSNLARTISFARSSALNSATNQFFFNTDDNANLDTAGGGYAVFGRVIAGWSVIQAVQGFVDVVDFNSEPRFTDVSGNVTRVPVRPGFTGTNISEDLLVRIVNAEIIKPSGFAGFFTQQVVMPEGQRTNATTETLALVNPNSVSAAYQVIVRYEWDTDRDFVIASGTLSANQSTQIKLSEVGNATVNTIRANTPYSVIVQTALAEGTANPRPIGAQVNRVDFGGDTADGLFNPAGFSDESLRSWSFGRIERNDQSREFITWVNLSDQRGTVTLTILTPGGEQTFTQPVQAYRRGGFSLAALGLPSGVLSARVTSTQNIVAYLSDFDLPQAGVPGANAQTPAWGVFGQAGGGSNIGSLANVSVQAATDNIISVYNPGSTVAAITFRAWRTGRLPGEDPLTNTQVVFAGTRTDLALATITGGQIPDGEAFSITYTSGSANVTVQYTSVASAARGSNVATRSDGVSTHFVSRVGPETYFAGGFLDPSRTNGSLAETVSIWNPFSSSTTTFSYTLRFTFSDGSTIDAFSGTLAPNARVDLLTTTSSLLRTKAGQNVNFRNYGISVLATATTGSTTTTAAGVVQLTRTDSSLVRSITTTGMNSGPGIALGDAFAPPSSGT